MPDLVLVNQGTNDALCGAADDAVRAAAHAWLWGARAALGATPLLALVLPFGGFCAAPLRAAFADYQRGAEWLRAVAAAADAAGPTDGGDELSGASERSLDSNTSTDTACESTDTNATEECRRFAVSPPRDERCVLLDLGREAHSCTPPKTSCRVLQPALERTRTLVYSAVFRGVHCICSPELSRGALKTLHITAFPP